MIPWRKSVLALVSQCLEACAGGKKDNRLDYGVAVEVRGPAREHTVGGGRYLDRDVSISPGGYYRTCTRGPARPEGTKADVRVT